MSLLVMGSTQHSSQSWSILSSAHPGTSQWVSSGTLTALVAKELAGWIFGSNACLVHRSLPCPEPDGGRSCRQAGPR